MSTRYPLITVVVLWFAGLCAAAQFAKVGHFLPELQQRYVDAGASLGFLVSLISLMGALLGLIAGVVVARLGPRTLLLIGLWLGLLMSFLQIFSPPLIWMLASRVVEGLSHLAIVVAAPTLIAHYSSDHWRSAAMTLWGTFFGVSFALTAWLGLPLVSRFGIDALFAVHAVALAISLIGVSLWVPATLKKAEPDTLPRQRASWARELFTAHYRIWRSPHTSAPAAGWLFYTLTFVALLSVIPGWLPPAQRTTLSAVLPLVSIASSVTLGIVLLKVWPAVSVVVLGFAAAIMATVLLMVLPNTALWLTVLFAALGLIQGASFASVTQLNQTTTGRAEATGALAQAGNIGNLCGTPLLLSVQQSQGALALGVALMACYVLGMASHLANAYRRQPASNNL